MTGREGEVAGGWVGVPGGRRRVSHVLDVGSPHGRRMAATLSNASPPILAPAVFSCSVPMRDSASCNCACIAGFGCCGHQVGKSSGRGGSGGRSLRRQTGGRGAARGRSLVGVVEFGAERSGCTRACAGERGGAQRTAAGAQGHGQGTTEAPEAHQGGARRGEPL